jgi:superkiller protein 3
MKTACLSIVIALLVVPATADEAADTKKVKEAEAKAEEQLQKGKPEEALKTAQKVAQQLPGNPGAHLLLGRVQERIDGAENLEAAAVSVAKALELSPPGSATRADVLATLAGLDLLRGSSRDAAAHAKEAADLQPTPPHFALLARARARAGDTKGALEAADRADQAGAGSAAAHAARGAALLAMKRSDEAAAAFRKAIEADPKLNWGRIGLAFALVASGKGAEAVAEAKKATEADPKSGEAFAAYGLALLVENPKNWNGAIEQAQQGAFLNPHNSVVQYAVGQIFEAADNFDQATVAYKKAAGTDPGFVPTRLAMLRLQVRRGELDAALAEARKIVADAPGNGEALLRLGEILLRKDDNDEALAPLQKAVELVPGSAEAHYFLGRAYHFNARLPQAVESYKRAVELAPSNVDYRITYGLMLGVTGQHETGIAELTKVVQSPGYKGAAAHANLGWIYRNMTPKKTAESIAAYKKALELEPKNAQAALGLGWAYSYSRMWEEAIAAFKKAVELDPKVAGEAHDGIGWCYFFKKDMPGAREHLEKAKAAGRNDVRLAEQIAKVEKLIAEKASEKIAQEMEREVETGPDIGAVSRDLMYSKSPEVRRRAAREMTTFGKEAVPFLEYTAGNDADPEVQAQACRSLGALGAAARKAVPTLKNIVNRERTMPMTATAEDIRREGLMEDARRACAEALRKIEGR